MDPEAPDLEEYLGPVGRIGLDFHAARGELEVVGGIQKNLLGCNWKLAVDNIYDFYHAQVSHASAYMSGFRRIRDPNAPETPHYLKLTFRSVLGDYGHAIGGPKVTPEMLDMLEARGEKKTSMLGRELWRREPGAAEIMGPVGIEAGGHPGIFPNLWVTSNQVCIRLPRGPMVTELWWFTLVDKNASEQERSDMIHQASHNFGPAGMLEQDDGENWDQSTRAAKGVVAGRHPLHFGMGLGAGEVQHIDDTTFIDSPINEYPQFWTYLSWAEWMDAASWADLKRNHTPAPVTGRV
jgi:phenylpropionate dioxygenase-like ring-hydroxylating dioxygenase large terminal subunit